MLKDLTQALMSSKIFLMKKILIIIYLLSKLTLSQNDWIHRVRISGNPLTLSNADSIIKFAEDSYVFGIEVDNDITGRYESFLNPRDKLEAIKLAAEKAHKAGNYAFVYIAGLECITGNADKKEHTFFKDHPDWVQRDINRKPALFGGKDAFWIKEGDEDVWISPYAKEWRKIYMERVKQIASTGIDGIYVDIPYWMTHFEGWEDTWASFDDFTVAEFKNRTGLNAIKDVKIGDFKDAHFIKWIKFRIATINEFMAEIDSVMKSVNAHCISIAEIYPGIGEDAVRVGADVYSLSNIVDVIAHEYSEGKYYASEREPFDWYKYIFGMQTFKYFAHDKPTWILSYSWNNDKKVGPRDAMQSLFASQIFNGINTWDVKTYIMSSTNDPETRRFVYKWILENSSKFYYKRRPLNPVGIYFSPETRNLFPDEYPQNFFGMIYLMALSHLDYEVITPRTLKDFKYGSIIFPDAKCLSEKELNQINELINLKKIIYDKKIGIYDESRNERRRDKTNAERLNFKSENCLLLEENSGKKFYELLESNLNNYFNSGSLSSAEISNIDSLVNQIKNFCNISSEIKIEAPINILTTFSKDENDNTLIHLINIDDLCLVCGNNKTNENVKITYLKELGSKISFLPFLENERILKPMLKNGEYEIKVPGFNRGAVITIRN